jgi:hypothetical protein
MAARIAGGTLREADVMQKLIVLAVCIAALCVAKHGFSQAPPPNAPTTVQLPTFSFFTVQTTVSVPDSGGAFLGGIGRGADGSGSRGFGPLANRGSGSSREAGGISVQASIHDREEMDWAVLAQAAENSRQNFPAAKAEQISGRIGRSEAGSSSGVAGSLAEIRSHQAAGAASRTAEATELFTKAQRAEAEGKSGLARIYYQMVLRRDGGSLRASAQSRLAALSEGTSNTVAAR